MAESGVYVVEYFCVTLFIGGGGIGVIQGAVNKVVLEV